MEFAWTAEQERYRAACSRRWTIFLPDDWFSHYAPQGNVSDDQIEHSRVFCPGLADAVTVPHSPRSWAARMASPGSSSSSPRR